MKRIVSFLLSLICAGSLAAGEAASFSASAAQSDAASNASAAPDFSGIGEVGVLSAAETKKIAAAVYDAVSRCQPEVRLKNYGIDLNDRNAEDIIAVYRAVLTCWDVGILAVNGLVQYSYWNDSIIIQYRYSGDEYQAEYHKCMEMLDDILSGVRAEWSEAEKALYLHDYISVHYDYDYPALYGLAERGEREQYSAYGMLKNGVAVCEGYSALYAILLNRLGIASLIVGSDNLNHAWNMVRIDGAWYFTDVTYDDAYTQYQGIVTHDNFLRTAAELTETGHSSTDWRLLASSNSVYKLNVPDTFKDAFWLKTNSAIVWWKNRWVSVRQSEDVSLVCDWNVTANGTADEETLTVLDRQNSTWYVWGKPNSYYTSTYVIPVVIGDTLFYSTPSAVYTIDEDSAQMVYELNDTEKSTGYLYGLCAEDNTLYYGIDTSTRIHSETLEKPVPYYALAVDDWVELPPVPDLKYDLNDDRAVSIADAVALARFVNEDKPSGAFQDSLADLDEDGILSIGDVSVLLNYLLLDSFS